VKELGEDVTGVELALLNRAEDAREHGVGPGATFGSVAAADFARDHGRAERLLGAPVGRVDRIGLEQKGKHRREFDREMRRESPGDACRSGPIDERIQLVLQMAARDRDPVGGDTPPLIAIAARSSVRDDRA